MKGISVGVETQAGDTLTVGDLKLTPRAQSFRLLVPLLHGGFIYNRPLDVLVQKADGEEELLPVPDVTRVVQLAAVMVAVFTALGFLLAWQLGKGKKIPR